MFYKIEETCCRNKGTKGSLASGTEAIEFGIIGSAHPQVGFSIPLGQAWGAILPLWSPEGAYKMRVKWSPSLLIAPHDSPPPAPGDQWGSPEGNGVFSELCDQVMEQGTWRGARSRQHSSTFWRQICPHIQEHLIYLKAKVGQEATEKWAASHGGRDSVPPELQNPKPLLGGRRRLEWF